jgi:hypothetical protein
MAITYAPSFKPKTEESRSNERRPKAPLIPLDQPGRLRISNLQALFGCSHATIYKRLEQGALPCPDGYDLPNRPKGRRGRPYWYTSTIRPFLGPSE